MHYYNSALHTCIYMCVQLAHGSDSDAVRLVDSYDWYIMPVINPIVSNSARCTIIIVHGALL